MSDLITTYPIAKDLIALRKIDSSNFIVEWWGAPNVVAIRAPMLWRSQPMTIERDAFQAASALAFERQGAMMFWPERGK